MNGFTLREKIIPSKKSHENVMILTLCCHGKEALSSEKEVHFLTHAFPLVIRRKH